MTEKPSGYLNASFEARVANVELGHESFFTDAESIAATERLSQFKHIHAVHNCPNAGYTRLSAHNCNIPEWPHVMHHGGRA